MDRGGVGDKRGSKEMDRCPLTWNGRWHRSNTRVLFVRGRLTSIVDRHVVHDRTRPVYERPPVRRPNLVRGVFIIRCNRRLGGESVFKHYF
jgi:hypothetical protein